MVRAVRFAPGRPDQLRSCGLDQRLLLHDRRLDAAVASADAGVPLTALSCRHDGLMAVGTAGARRAVCKPRSVAGVQTLATRVCTARQRPVTRDDLCGCT